jgi:acetyltransferase-like isoleucine patch superfamily enzyme
LFAPCKVTEMAACHSAVVENVALKLDAGQMRMDKTEKGSVCARERRASVGNPPTLLSRTITKLYTLWARTTYPFAAKGHGLSLHYASEISRSITKRLSLGDRVHIGKHAWLTLGLEGAHELKIVIGDDCRIGPQCSITAKNAIRLERGVILESDVLLMDHAHAYEDLTTPISEQGTTPGGRIRIEEGCWIGSGSAILCDRGELVLGRNCVVAPRAVVSRSFPPNSVISGNPAKAVPQSSAVNMDVEQGFTHRFAVGLAKQTR